MPAGRPTDYSDDIIQKTKDYIELCRDEWEVYERPDIKDGDVIDTQDVRKKVKLPSVEGLAVYLDVSRDTLYEWARVHTEFSYTLEKVKALQAETLINKGLSGDYNSTIAKLILTKHGYTDKTDVTSDGKQIFTNLKDTPDAELENLAKGGETGTSA